MGIKVDEVKEHVRRLDWKKLKGVLDAQSVCQELFDDIILIVWQSDSMVRRRPGDDGVKRDRFLEKLGEYFTTCGVSTAVEEIAKMHAELLKIDRGYVEVHSVVSKLDSARFSPEQRVSGVFSALDFSVRNMLEDFQRSLNASNGVLDINRNLQGQDQGKYDPNSNTHGLTVAAGDVVMLEAYKQGWFDSDGLVILPNLEPAEEGVPDAAVGNLVNANNWRLWKGIDERVRFLGGSIRQLSDELSTWKASVKIEGGPEIKSELEVAFEFEPEKKSELLDLLANERFDTISEQNLKKLYRETNIVKKIDKAGGFVALPPAGFVSVDEAHATLMYISLTKMDASKAKSGSLSVSEIIRGFAVLKKNVTALEKDQKTYFPLVTHAWLQAELKRCGLTQSAADAFIARSTFQRSSRDLYDQPLVKTVTGDFIIFGASLLLADITKILFSSLANEGANFDEKGEVHEAATIEMLRGHGFKARNLKVKRGANEEFDYDVAFVWDDHVFFLECKNRGLPMGNPIATYRFNNELMKHLKQVKRLKQGLADYPDILEKDFPEAAGKKAVFCLVNAMPYAIGECDGIYVIDDSILGRFFSSATIGLTVGRLDGKGSQIRTDLKRIWTGDKPTVADFIDYLAKPPQLFMAKENYEMAPKIEFLSSGACAKVTDFRRRDLNAHDFSMFLKKELSDLEREKKRGAGAKTIRSKAKKATLKAARKARSRNRGR